MHVERSPKVNIFFLRPDEKCGLASKAQAQEMWSPFMTLVQSINKTPNYKKPCLHVLKKHSTWSSAKLKAAPLIFLYQQ